jgi:hypothetical protein
MQKYQYIATSPRLPRHHPSSRGCSGQRRACLVLLGVLVQQVICCPAGTFLAVLYILQEVTVPHPVQSKAVRPARFQLTDTDTVSALQYVTMRSRGAAKYPGAARARNYGERTGTVRNYRCIIVNLTVVSGLRRERGIRRPHFTQFLRDSLGS